MGWADRQLPEAIKAYEQGLQLDEANEAMQKSKADVEADLAAKLKSEVEEEEAAKQAQQPVVPLEEREPVIGIDLGTTYSAVAVWDAKLGGVRMLPDENGKNTVPSYVAWAEDGERVIGERAKAMAARLPGRVLFDVKRVIEGRSTSSRFKTRDLACPSVSVRVRKIVSRLRYWWRMRRNVSFRKKLAQWCSVK